MTRLFVYGTLKRGRRNHLLLAAQHFLGPARTAPGFRLYDLGRYPGMVADTAGNAVTGELWLVSDECLAALDAFEGTDTGLYRRMMVTLEDGTTAACYLYAGPVVGRPELGVAY